MSTARLRQERGTTFINDRVVSRIVARTAAETEGTGGRKPRAGCTVSGEVVSARVELAVPYPAPVGEVTRRARERIRARVAELTGLTLRRIDIDVAALEPPERGR